MKIQNITKNIVVIMFHDLAQLFYGPRLFNKQLSIPTASRPPREKEQMNQYTIRERLSLCICAVSPCLVSILEHNM